MLQVITLYSTRSLSLLHLPVPLENSNYNLIRTNMIRPFFGTDHICTGYRRRQIRTPKVRRALPHLFLVGQIDNGQRLSEKSGQNPDSWQNRDRKNPDRHTSESLTKIRTESGQQTNTGRDFPDKSDKNKIGLGQKQCCPPTSDWVEVLFRIFLECKWEAVRKWQLSQSKQNKQDKNAV